MDIEEQITALRSTYPQLDVLECALLAILRSGFEGNTLQLGKALETEHALILRAAYHLKEHHLVTVEDMNSPSGKKYICALTTTQR